MDYSKSKSVSSARLINIVKERACAAPCDVAFCYSAIDWPLLLVYTFS